MNASSASCQKMRKEPLSQRRTVQCFLALRSTYDFSGIIRVPPIEKASPKRVLLHPFVILSTEKSPFTAEKRMYPIVMDYAFLKNEEISVRLPGNWRVESLPESTSFENDVGKTTSIARVSGNTITFARDLELKQAFWPESYYEKVKALFQAYERLEDLAAVLTGK